MTSTLEGYFASDFAKLATPPTTFQNGGQDLNSDSTRTLAAFSMPSGTDTVKVLAAAAANQGGSAVSGLSLVVKDDVNDSVIHSETSAQVATGEPIAEGGSADTRIVVELKNETGANETQPTGFATVTLE